MDRVSAVALFLCCHGEYEVALQLEPLRCTICFEFASQCITYTSLILTRKCNEVVAK